MHDINSFKEDFDILCDQINADTIEDKSDQVKRLNEYLLTSYFHDQCFKKYISTSRDLVHHLYEFQSQFYGVDIDKLSPEEFSELDIAIDRLYDLNASNLKAINTLHKSVSMFLTLIENVIKTDYSYQYIDKKTGKPFQVIEDNYAEGEWG